MEKYRKVNPTISLAKKDDAIRPMTSPHIRDATAMTN